MTQPICQCAADTRMPCLREGGGFVCGRCGLRISQTHVAAYPECAEKDAEIARLRAALQSIADHEIACKDCADDHDEDSCETMRHVALAALKGGA